MGAHLISFWLDSCGEPLTPRPPLPGAHAADVAIVGAGYTGLWTAYYLARRDPTLRIVVLEKEIAGFGASGRNGGWCSALFPTSANPAMRAALVDAVADVGRWCTAEGVDAHYVRGGMLSLARTSAQATRLRAHPDTTWLPAKDVASRVQATGVLGAAYDPECAALHPARLVRGLARVVASHGVDIYERTEVTGIAPGRVDTVAGTVRADVVVRAAEAWTATLPGSRRDIAPVYSLVIATEPLPASVWDQIGWAGRETVTDGRHLIVYAQRTADDRIVFGGRGAPYHFGSRIGPAYDRVPQVFGALRSAMVDLWPAVKDATVTHQWGGPLGVPRDFHPSVGFNRSSGLAWAGGYVGDGVAASNLAGRTLADLITDNDSALVHLPWVGHRSRRWEPEPLRWLGVNGVRWLASSVDSADARGRRAPVRARLLDRLTGG
ncbi:MAG: NAD(P)/FAD-dependent oxidoreductase [Actinomycetes bacterium]